MPLVLLFIAALLFRLVLFFTIGYTTDDALITFRYAENIASGQGFVYNAGERVLGTTTPLWTLLLALLVKLGVNIFTAAFILASLSDLFAAMGLLRLLGKESGISWLAAIVYLFNPETLQWSLSGMETSLSVALILSAFAYAAQARWAAAFVLSALCALTRIDGVAVPGALGLAYLIRERRLPWKEVFYAVVVVLPWFIFAWLYFGSLMPNSAAAKMALSGGNRFVAGVTILLKGFLHLHSFGVPFFILAILGTVAIFRTHREYLPIVFWTWGYAFSYSLAAGPMHPWYYTPFYAGYLVLILVGVAALLSRYPALAPGKTFAVFAVLTIIIVLLLSYYRTRKLAEMQAHMLAVNRAVGTWIQENTEPDAVFAVKDIGYLGYYSQRRILDLAGLVSPECIPFRASNDFLGPIKQFQPDYFAFSEGQIRNLGLDQSGVLKSYRPVHILTNQYGTFRIYSRRIDGNSNR